MQQKTCHLYLSEKNVKNSGTFSGYASVFNVVDKQNHIILPGAFNSAVKNLYRVKLLWQHNSTEPIGNITNMIENDVGLYVTATLLLDLQKGKEAYLMLKNGIINALSIGYTIIDDYVDMKTGLRVLKKISLWEISLVTFPANVHSKITDVKDIRDSLTISISNAKSALDKLSSMTDL